MSLFQEKYSGPQFANIIGVEPENLRDWRRRGIDLGIGSPHDGRKKYCDYDLLEAELLRVLRSDLLDNMRETLAIARWIAPSILERNGISADPHPMKIWNMAHGDTGKRFYVSNELNQKKMVNDLSEALKDWPHSLVCRVVDCEALAKKMAAWIAGELGQYKSH